MSINGEDVIAEIVKDPQLAHAIDVKRRCCRVPMDEALDWLYAQEQPTIFDFSDWVENERSRSRPAL